MSAGMQGLAVCRTGFPQRPGTGEQAAAFRTAGERPLAAESNAFAERSAHSPSPPATMRSAAQPPPLPASEAAGFRRLTQYPLHVGLPSSWNRSWWRHSARMPYRWQITDPESRTRGRPSLASRRLPRSSSRRDRYPSMQPDTPAEVQRVRGDGAPRSVAACRSMLLYGDW